LFLEEQNKEEVCCPRLNSELWNEKIFEWKNKKFVKASVFTLFFMPINFGAVISKLMGKAGKYMSKESMCLSDHTSKWNMDIYVVVDKEVEGLDNVSLGGKFLSKVYEGNFKDTGIWCQDFENMLKVKK